MARRFQNPPLFYIAAVVLALLIAAAWFVVEKTNLERHQTQIRNNVLLELTNIRDRIDHRLFSDLQLVKGLVSVITLHPDIDQESYARAVAPLFSEQSQIRNIAAAPDMVIRFTYPMQGNEAALGLDYRKHPTQFAAADRARTSRKIVLAGPINLVQGGTGLVARYPVFLNDQDGNEYFWGLISSVIDDKKLLQRSVLNPNDLPLQLAIRGRDGLGSEGEVFWGSPKLFEQAPVTLRINLPEGYWELAGVPQGGWSSPPGNLIWLRLAFLLLFGLLGTAFLAISQALRKAAKAQAETENARDRLRTSVMELQEREYLLRTVIDQMPDVLVLKDHQGNFVLTNKTVADLYGTTPDAMVGKQDHHFGVPREMSDFFRNNVLEIMARGETDIVYEDSRDANTGEIRHLKSIKKPFKSAQGENQILVIAQDITDIIRAQQKIEASEQKLNTILDNVDAFIFLKDLDGNYLFANRAVRELWNQDIEDIVGFGDEKFFDAESAAQIRAHDARVLQQGEVIRETEHLNVPEGTARFYQVTKLPLRDEHGDIYALCGISVDITELKQTEQALLDSEQRFRVAGKAAYDLIYEWDVKTDTLTWYGDIDTILGFEQGKISQDIDAWRALVHSEDEGFLNGAAERRRNSRDPILEEYRIRTATNEYRHWKDHALPMLDEQGKPYKWVGVCTDITAEKKHQDELERNAYFDPLTSLPNRALLTDRLRTALKQENRRKEMLALVFIDLDGFKEINDKYGHDVGDRMLISVAKRFQAALREGDTIARLGGDEFVAVLMDIKRERDCIPLLERLLDAVRQPSILQGESVQLSASLGVVLGPYQAEEVDADQLLRQADFAMYQAKLAGKNRYEFFDTDYDRNLRGRRESMERIREGLENSEFELYYQPKVNMLSGDVVGVEALIRWQHPEQGLLPPGVFLPVIEDQDLAIELGEWVLDTALQQIRNWQTAGLPMAVSVNIGAHQMQAADFTQRLATILARYPEVDAQKLELEVLETSALEDVKQTAEIMRECQQLGVTFALDDFGTGYSSLTYLKNLPAASLKIDRNFVRDMLIDPDDLAILEGIIGMSAAFRRTVIAEGVESEEHGEILLKLGCDLAQGYGIARPMPAEDILDWITRWKPYPTWVGQERVRHEDLGLLYAATEHRAWIREVEEKLQQQSDTHIPLSHHDCRFGTWLENEGAEKYGHLPAFTNTLAIHETLHTYAAELLENNAPEDRAGLGKLHAMREALLESLDELLKQSQEHRSR